MSTTPAVASIAAIPGIIEVASLQHELSLLLHQQRDLVNTFFDQLETKQAAELFHRLLHCRGNVIFTGVGKSGLIAEKLATTMASTGTKALFLPPTNLLHGDLGMVAQGDIFIALSKSGESDELLHLIPFVRNKGAELVAWVSRPGSRLEKACDLAVMLPLERELCPFDLAPTTSASIQLLFGDVLAVALMRAKGFALDDYARNHPAGRIGKQIALKVSDLMLTGDALPVCRPDALLVDELVELSNKRCGCLLAVEEGQLVGIFTDGDLRRALERKGADALQSPIRELMTISYRSIEPQALAVDAVRKMEADQQRPITVLPVTSEDRLLGLIKMHDILQSGI